MTGTGMPCDTTPDPHHTTAVPDRFARTGAAAPTLLAVPTRVPAPTTGGGLR